ncbi:hypothetical protein SPI_05194 [Niveomyces insectorum RCEF 264]|uniref:Fibroin-3 related protein n=1 Tax=Niveomyces insectorum RCEF 264 TaxID=1081102 RepID=A0A167U216_9HYPO|nr:hypothetical protein SPI_05194 [Niveomyces insectorum RCEF 264]
MPSVDIAMAHSLGRRRGALDVLAAALEPVLTRRDAITNVEGKITDVKTAFSSWDNCMKATFCKWPVIAIIIVGGLFLLSILWCIARCAFCGLSCCCECCYCLKCCGDCCGCCDPPRGKNRKYLDEPYIPPNQGYRSEAPMAPGALAAMPTYKPPVHDVPQFADFEVSKPAHVGEDALPVMPSWENASKKKVYLEDEPVEMDDLKKPGGAGQAAAPLLVGSGNGSPGSTSPNLLNSPNHAHSPYSPSHSASVNNLGSVGHPAVSNGYLAAGAIPAVAGAAAPVDPYGRSSPGYTSPNNGGAADYGADYGHDYSYGASAAGMGSRTQSPRPYNDRPAGYGSSPSPPQQLPPNYMRNNQSGNYYDEYRRNGAGASTPQAAAYGVDRRSPRIPELGTGDNSADYGPGVGAGAGAGGARYGSPGPYGPPTSRSPANGRPLNGRPPPQRQYPGSSTGSNGYNSSNNRNNGNGNGNGGYDSVAMPASPTLQNSGGFDFHSGNSRPQTREHDDYNNGSGNNYNAGYENAGSSINNNINMNYPPNPSPLAQPQPEGSAYPGYRAYRG